MSLEKIPKNGGTQEKRLQDQKEKSDKLTTSKLAKKLKKTTDRLNEELLEKGYLEEVNGGNILTEQGKQAGGESKKGRFGAYFLWDSNLCV